MNKSKKITVLTEKELAIKKAEDNFNSSIYLTLFCGFIGLISLGIALYLISNYVEGESPERFLIYSQLAGAIGGMTSVVVAVSLLLTASNLGTLNTLKNKNRSKAKNT